jgi:hypothetical protein
MCRPIPLTHLNQKNDCFFMDLTECLQRVHKWPEKENEFFLKNLEENGLENRAYRVPRDSHSNLGQIVNLAKNQKVNADGSKSKSTKTLTGEEG